MTAQLTFQFFVLTLCGTAALAVPLPAHSQTSAQPKPATVERPAALTDLPKDYVIGVDDLLGIIFWREKEMSAEVLVRPDGKISLPLIGDLPAAGMTPEQLADAVEKAGTKYVKDAGATVMVREIRSRKVYVIGEVTKPGTFSLGSEMRVMQIIAEAGGFLEHSNKGNVVIVRNENGQEHRYKFNYNEVVRGRNVQQNILLLPGDTILVR